jgi:aminoacyl tRNA synthase complex-interacting multifunctional protein 1
MLVCVAANLKPAKLAGEPSQAMVLAADATGADGQTIVKTLQPPGVFVAGWVRDGVEA